MMIPERALSPSQIKTWKDCHRKWGLLYIDKRPSKPNRFAEFGTAMHKVAEDWFLNKKMPSQKTQEGRAFMAGIHYWPSPEFVDAVEGHIDTATSVSKYHGYRDLEFFDRDLGLWVIGDHKTCGSFQYALTKEELKEDEQAMIYVRSAMERRGVDRAMPRWVYYKRNAPHGAKRVQLVVLKEDVDRVFQEQIDPTALEIHEAYASITNGMDCEPNALSCSKFGGCEFQSVCNLSSMERLRSYMANEKMAEKLAARKAAAASGINPPEKGRQAPAATPPETESAEPPTTTAATAPTVTTSKKDMAAQFAARKAAAAAKAQSPERAAEAPAQATASASKYEKPAVSSEVGLPRQLFRLLIDCRPVRPIVNYVLAAEIAQEANIALSQRLGVIDYRAVEFGKGRAELQVATRLSIELWLEKKLIKAGDTIVLYTSNGLEADSMDMFLQYASEIVRP